MTNKTKSYCNKCTGHRNHEVLHRENTSWEEHIADEYTIYGDDVYEMVKCCGCEKISFCHQSRFSEDIDVKGDLRISTNYYPAAIYRKKPKWINDLLSPLDLNDSFVSDVIDEIYIALQNNSHRLAVLGIRALIEHIMIDNIGDNGSFSKNLNKFQSEGFISKLQRNSLEPIIEVGHATMHRAFSPSEKDLIILIDVTESIIESIYINEQRAKKISKKIPKRAKTK